VDYLQLCKSLRKTESRRQEVEDISRAFKEMSLEFKIPVIVLSQLSRDNAKTGREPELHDLRESGSIEQDADNVIFLHVPKDTDETTDCFDIKIIVAKQRNGATGFIYLRYYRRTFKLCNIK
jgi:replicative DNA helicase